MKSRFTSARTSFKYCVLNSAILKIYPISDNMPEATVESKTIAAATSSPATKRLVFDRRYGWVLDEWKEPTDEALSGGRGMFCILPLARAVLEKASDTINIMASSTLEVLERPDVLLPKLKHCFSIKELNTILMTSSRDSKRKSTD